MNYYNETYSLISKSDNEVISLADMKLYLKVDGSDEDDLISALIDAAVKTAEIEMNRDLLETNWIRYSDTIEQDLTLRRGKILEFDSIEYLKSSVYKEVDSSDYEVASGSIYAEIWRVEIPESYDENPHAIKISFKTGFGASGSSIPADIIVAIKAHVAYLFENRGDCSDGNARLPITSKIIYQNNQIIDINGVL